MLIRGSLTLSLSIIVHLMLIIRLTLIFIGLFLVGRRALALARISIVEAFGVRL